PTSPCGRPLELMVLDGQSISPVLALPRPAMMRSAVDLPQPDGPSRLRNSPRCTSSDMSLSASVPLENTLETFRIETTTRDAPAERCAEAAAEISVKSNSPG